MADRTEKQEVHTHTANVLHERATHEEGRCKPGPKATKHGAGTGWISHTGLVSHTGSGAEVKMEAKARKAPVVLQPIVALTTSAEMGKQPAPPLP